MRNSIGNKIIQLFQLSKLPKKIPSSNQFHGVLENPLFFMIVVTKTHIYGEFPSQPFNIHLTYWCLAGNGWE